MTAAIDALEEAEYMVERASGFSGDLVEDAMRARIGELITRWSFIEFQLKVVVREGFAIDWARTLTLTHAKDVRALCQLVSNLIATDHWIASEPVRTELAGVVATIGRNTNGRNDYAAHAVYGIPSKGPHTGRMCRYLHKELRHKIEPQFVPVTLKDLEKKCKAAKNLGALVQNATVHLKDWKKSVRLRLPKR